MADSIGDNITGLHVKNADGAASNSSPGAVAPGQSAVVYRGEVLLGGGVIGGTTGVR